MRCSLATEVVTPRFDHVSLEATGRPELLAPRGGRAGMALGGSLVVSTLLSGSLALAAGSARAGMVTDPHGNVGYDTAEECDAAVQAGNARFYRSFTFKPPLRRQGEASVTRTTLAGIHARYRFGACDLGVGRKLGRDGVSPQLVGRYIPFSPNMEVNAYWDRNGNLVRLSMHQCDNWFSGTIPRPVSFPLPPSPPPPPPPPPPAVAPRPQPAPPPPPQPAPRAQAPAQAPAPAPVAPTPAASNVSGPYLFGGVGAMRDTGQLFNNFTTYARTEPAAEVGAGYQFNSLLGAELAYVAAQRFHPSSTDAVTVRDLQARMTLGGQIAQGLRAFGKIGAARVTHGFNGASDSQIRPTVGFGLLLDLTSNWGLRLDLDHVFKRSKDFPKWKENDYLGLGLQYRF